MNASQVAAREDGGTAAVVEGFRSSGLPTTATRPADASSGPRCQQPHLASLPGTAEGFVALGTCTSAASALVVHRAQQIDRLDAAGEVVPFALRRPREVVQVAASCLVHVASALRLNEAERRVLAAPRTSVLRVREHVEVHLIGAPVTAVSAWGVA